MKEGKAGWFRHLGAVVMLGWAGWCLAQPADFPSKPITVVSPFSPGGSDLVVRQYTNWITPRNPKWTFVIDFKPGAQGAIALGQVAKAPPDGYMLTLASGSLLLTEVMEVKPSFALEQFSPVFRLYGTPQVLMVNGVVPAKSLSELVAYARANPGKLNFGVIGLSGVQRLTGEFMQELLGVKFTYVPYKGAAPIGAAVMSGEVDLSLQAPRNTLPAIHGGKVRGLAHTGSANFRFPDLPELRSFSESGAPAFEHAAWAGLVAPAGTPLATRTAMNRMFNEPFKDPAFEPGFLKTGDVPVRNSIEDFEKFVQGQKDRWVGTANRLGIRLSAD